jgi:hypothetical protein
LNADAIVPSSLLEEPDLQEPAVEEHKAEELPDDAQPVDPHAQAQAAEPVEMTFGYPNSLLIENDIDPQMLYEFPEELRAEILSTIQEQFEEWQQQQNQLA